MKLHSDKTIKTKKKLIWNIKSTAWVMLIALIGMTSCSSKGHDYDSGSSYSYNENSNDSESLYTSTVYITPHGHCYHSTTGCPTLHKSKIINEVSESDIEHTRKPCKICH